MDYKQFRILIAAIAVLFLMSMMNTCSSCSTARKLDEVSARQDKAVKLADSTASIQMRTMENRLDMLQPQIVNQFLGLFNAEKYKNEIDLNKAKIEALKQQLKNEQLKNGTPEKH